MFNDYEDFYGDYNEFDRELNELKTSLVKGIKQEYIEKMERLEKQNKELLVIKKDFDSIKRHYENEEKRIIKEKADFITSFKKQTLQELFEDYGKTFYKLDSTSIAQPKCDLCDENRKLHFQTPDGENHRVSCSCSYNKTVYHVKEVKITYIEIDKRKNKDITAKMYFEVVSRPTYLDEEDYRMINDRIRETFEKDKHYYNTVYTTIEEAQKACDFKNGEKNK
jgi:hypothetical protein